MPECKVTILKSGQADVPGPEVYWMSHWFEWETLYFHMVLIQGEGITAIVDTGPPADLTQLNELFGTLPVTAARCCARKTNVPLQP